MNRKLLYSIPWTSIIFSLFIITACQTEEFDQNIYQSLTGESDHWTLNGYEISLTPEAFTIGNGTLQMKTESEYMTNYFSYRTYAVISNKDEQVIHAGSKSGERVNIANITIGTIDGPPDFNENGNPISMEDITELYMVVEWRDIEKQKDVAERIELYKQNETKALNGDGEINDGSHLD